MRVRLWMVVVTTLMGTSCIEAPTDESTSPFDQALLARYRLALPQGDLLLAHSPPDAPDPTLQPLAVYPPLGEVYPPVINNFISAAATVLHSIAQFPPSYHNTETTEVVWGPYPNPEDFGTVALLIKEDPEFNPDYDAEQPSGSPFRYLYAFLRGDGYDQNSLTTIISGGSTPDEEEPRLNFGTMVWDFEANAHYLRQYAPTRNVACIGRGRFVTSYGGQRIEFTQNDIAQSVLTYIRNFVPKTAPGAVPQDITVLHGNADFGSAKVAFMNFGFQAEVDGDPTAPEEVSIQMAWYHEGATGNPEGTGRAQVEARNDTMHSGQKYQTTECWDPSLKQTYFLFEFVNTDQRTPLSGFGTEEDCGQTFQTNLLDLNIPSFATFPPSVLQQLENVALHGPDTP